MDRREMGWGVMDMDLCGSEWRPVEGSFEYGNEHSGSIKYWIISE
jgi:hypothetical protein